jgi:hypothetical protein
MALRKNLIEDLTASVDGRYKPPLPPGVVEAAKLIGMKNVPTVRLSHLDAAQRRAYVLADNKLALNAGWDREVLAIELQALIDLDFGAEITGFSLAEIDLVLDEARESSPLPPTPGMRQTMRSRRSPTRAWPPPGRATSGSSAGIACCAATRHRQGFDCLLDGGCADLVFTDPHYNVAIDGHVCGLGRIRHREFAMGAGEMSRQAFTGFLRLTLGHAAARVSLPEVETPNGSPSARRDRCHLRGVCVKPLSKPPAVSECKSSNPLVSAP